MAEYTLISPFDIRLNRVANEVTPKAIGSQHVQSVLAEMSRIALGERTEENPALPSLVGLAAPQIGVNERIIIIDMNATPNKSNFDIALQTLINPRITYASDEEELGREGCYSTGNITGAVLRARRVTITGVNEHGTQVSKALNGFLARIAQHEIDHLNGTRFPDRIRDPKYLHRLDFDSSEFQRYRENWLHWTKLCTFEDWVAMKMA